VNALLREKIRNTVVFQMGLPFQAGAIAKELGMTRQNVARELYRMRARGEVRSENNMFIPAEVRHWIFRKRLANTDFLRSEGNQ